MADDFQFRVMTRQDFDLFSEWLSRPHVERWWEEPSDRASIEARYGPSIDGADPTELYIVELDGRPMGFIQWYLLDDNPEWKAALAVAGDFGAAAGIDYLIGDEQLVGQGLGPRLIDAFVVARSAHHPAVRQVVVDVDQSNRPSWRALEKAGFHRVWAGRLATEEHVCFVYERRLGPTGS